MKRITAAVAIFSTSIAAWAQAPGEATHETPEVPAEEATAPEMTTAIGAESYAVTDTETVAATDTETATETAAESASAQGSLQGLTPADLEALVKRLVQEELAKEREERGETKAIDGGATGGRGQPQGFILPDFSKTGITFIMGDDNLRDDSQYSVKWDIGQRPEYEDFFERVYGYSNTAAASTRLTLYHREDGLLPNLSTRIGLAFKIYNQMDNIDDQLKTNIVEDRSFIELEYTLRDVYRFMLTLYPYNADQVAIGYLRGLRWGTREVYPQIDKSTAVPGFQLLFGREPISVYFGFKTHAQEIKDKLNTEFVPKETVYSAFGGFSVRNLGCGGRRDCTDHRFSGHLQGAYVDKGENPKLDDALLSDPFADQIHSYGVNVFAEYAWGAPIGDPLGINAYNNREWMRPSYEGDWAVRVRSEYLYLSQLLQNADYLAIENDGTVQPITGVDDAHAFALEAAGRFRMFRLMGLFSVRTLSFLAFDLPGVNPFETITSHGDTRPEVAGSLHADANLSFIKPELSLLWLGAGFGLKMPATYTIYDESNQPIVTVIKDRITSQSISYSFDRTRDVLPPGRQATEMLFIKVNVKAEFTKSVSAMLEYTFTMDHNRAKLVEYIENGVGTGTFITDWDDETVRNIHGVVFSVEGRF